jgi:hypothetical protein
MVGRGRPDLFFLNCMSNPHKLTIAGSRGAPRKPVRRFQTLRSEMGTSWFFIHDKASIGIFCFRDQKLE